MQRRRIVAALAAGACARVAGAAVAPSQKEILVGQTTALSGPYARDAAGSRLGSDAFFAALNAQGGINGRAVRMLSLDDGFQPDAAVHNARALAQQGAVCIFQPYGTGPSLALAQAVGDTGLPLVAPISGAQALYRPNPLVFHTRASFADEYERIVQHLVTLGLTRLAMVHMDNPGGHSSLETVRGILERARLRLAATFALSGDGGNAARGVAPVGDVRPMAVIFACTTQAVLPFLRAYHAAGHRSSYYHISFTDGQAAYAAAPADAVGWVVSQVAHNPYRHETVKLVADYQRDMRAAGRPELSYAGVEGYASAKVLCTALQRLRGEPRPGALEALGTLDLGGNWGLHFAPGRHAGSRYVELVMVGRDGRYVR
jgi:ABC-type branched-subunit amino acid transport system substrate-binding protein